MTAPSYVGLLRWIVRLPARVPRLPAERFPRAARVAELDSGLRQRARRILPVWHGPPWPRDGGSGPNADRAAW